MKKLILMNIMFFLVILSGCSYDINNNNEIDNIKPRIEGLHNFTVSVNTTELDYLNGITAIDDDNVDITENIIVDDSLVDLNTVGAYLLSYKVIDDDQNETISYVIVNVVNETITTFNGEPTITGIKSFNIRVNSSKPDYLSGLSAIDDLDGDITSEIVIDDNNVDLTKAGVYIISYSVTDSNGNTEKVYSFVYVYDVSENQQSITSIIDSKKDAIVGISNIYNNQIIGTGSGVVYKKENNDYYILTNYHVIEGNAELEVVFNDYSFISAALIGFDIETDLAVLKININKQLPVISFARHEEINVGNEVIAIGNPLGYELFGSVTTGIVSGIDRSIPVDTNGDEIDDTIMTLLQHDAAINPGNSGGALLNTYGELIGINNLKIIGEDIDTIGFAIPIRTIERVVSDIETNYQVIRPFLGLDVISLNQAFENGYTIPNNVQYGAYANYISYKSPAYYCGLEKGDVIIAINDITIYNDDQFNYEVFLNNRFDTIKITYYNRMGIMEQTYATLN